MDTLRAVMEWLDAAPTPFEVYGAGLVALVMLVRAVAQWWRRKPA